MVNTFFVFGDTHPYGGNMIGIGGNYFKPVEFWFCDYLACANACKLLRDAIYFFGRIEAKF